MLESISKKVYSGRRLSARDAVALFESDDIFTIGGLAAYSARKKNGNRAYFIRNLHVNPSNICVNRCRFCAFSRSRGEEGAFELSIGDIVKKIRKSLPLSEVHIVGGLHPDWPFEHYLKMLGKIKNTFPKIHIKAFTAAEVDYFTRISGLSIREVLKRLRESGLGSMPGGGAEIFNGPVREKLCPEKLSGHRWLEVMETAHGLGIKSNATMLYGHMESHEDRIDHMMRLRRLQDRTGGFQAFIPLRYHPDNTGIGVCGGSGPMDDLKTIAVSRLVLDNFPHIKAYWVMLGEKVSQTALLFGADDIDGTVIDEKITRSAGGKRSGISVGELVHLIKRAGKRPVERDSYYRRIP